MPSPIFISGGSPYLRDGPPPHRKLGLDPVADYRACYRAGRTAGQPNSGGRPTKGDEVLAVLALFNPALASDPEVLRQYLQGAMLSGGRVQADPDNPNGYPDISVDDAIRGLLDAMEDGRTKDGYASALNIQADALGRESWAGWVDWWSWIYRTYTKANSRQTHISAANKLIAHGRKRAVRKYIPDFKPLSDKPERTKKQKLAEKRAEQASIAYDLTEARAMTSWALVHNGAGHYSTLAEYICALTGLHIGDARVMLGGWNCERCSGTTHVRGIGGRKTPCEECQDYGFEWNGPGGLVWYRGYRTKTKERINIPLAPTLANLLRPFRDGRRLKYEGAPGQGTSGSLPRSTMQYRTAHDKIEAKSGVAKIKGQSFKRYRIGFQHTLQNVLRLPTPVRRRLMAHKVAKKNDGAIGAYAGAEDRELADAILAVDALFLSNESKAN